MANNNIFGVRVENVSLGLYFWHLGDEGDDENDEYND